MQTPLTLATDLARRYFAPIDRVCQTLAHHAALNRLAAMLLCLVWARLRRTLQRLDRLALRWQAGARLTPRARAPRTPRGSPPPATPGLFAGATPQARGWLLRLCPHATLGISTVEQMLADPEIAALIAAAPQAGRLLRPLARMFGLDLPAHLRLPPRPKPPPKPKPARPPGPDYAEITRHDWPYLPPTLRRKISRRRKLLGLGPVGEPRPI